MASSQIIKSFKLPQMPTLSDLVKLYKLRAVRSLSQNFLLDKNINNKIIKSAGNFENSFVMEIGPGPGGLTRAAIEAGAKEIVVVEKDLRFMPGLQLLSDKVNPHVNLKLFHSDALTFPMGEHINKELYKKPWDSDEIPSAHLIGNLPFNISTPLLFKLLTKVSDQTGIFATGRIPMTFLFQEEFAERMICPPDFKQRSRVSVLCQYLCDVEVKFIIPNTAFVPSPKVNAAVVRMQPLKIPRIKCSFDIVSKVVKATFQFKHKNWHAGTRTLFPKKYPEFDAKFNTLCKVNPEKLPTELNMLEWNEICSSYNEIVNIFPELANYDYRHNINL